MKFKVFKFKNVKSTNNTAIAIIKKKNIYNGMIVSEKQSGGKGQYGKKWISLNGNLFLSFFFRINNLNISLRKLTKLNCLLVKKILSYYYKSKIIYKRPNDLLINKKKICGILQETISKSDEKYLIIGIGINLIKNPNIKNYPTTNLYDLTKKKISKKKIEKKLKEIFEIELTKFIKFKRKIS